jgi:L-lactate dehydrogenase complex protein LldF
MNDKGIVFNNNAKKIAFDDEHYEMMMSRYDFFMQNVKNRSNYYANIDLEKQRAFNIRSKAFKKLDKLLVDFDTNFTQNGGNLLWANDSDEAKKMIYDIFFLCLKLELKPILQRHIF